MAFYLTEEQVELLRAVDRTSPTGYADIYDLIHFFVQASDPFGNAADENVVAWFGAAKDANRGVGGASEFIRSYTAYQLEMRNGAPITGINSLIQNASNEIARSVYDDILRSGAIKDGVTYYELPTAMEIGAQDAAATVDTLANYPGGVANWSGNPLFIGLGITDFWSDTILDEDDNAYDLALSVGGMFNALGASSSAGLLDLFSLLLGQGLATASSASSAAFAAGATHSYLNRAYGDANLGIGDLVAGGMILGSAANETLSSDAAQSSLGWLHAGGGADVILAATAVGEAVNECGVFDGGEGDDRMSFNNGQITAAGGVVATISDWVSGIPFSAVVTATYDGRDLDSTLFNIERLDLSDADDRLVIDSMATTLQEIDALDSEDQGDTLDASDLASSFAFDLQSGAFTAGGASLVVKNFENAVGGSGADSITGSDQANILHGGSGIDHLFGGGADDFIFFDAEDTAVYGGAGRDFAVALGQDGVTVDMAAQGLECVIGCDGDDTITVTAADQPVFAAGGGGADHFILDNLEAQGPRILWGGAGADHFEFQNGGRVSLAVVNIDGLTEEAFSRLTLADLGLGEIDVSLLSAIVINPDAADRFYSDDGVIGTTSVNLRDWWEIGDDPELLDLLLPGSAPVSLDVRTSDVLGGSYSVQGVFRNEVRAIHEVTLQYNYYDVTVRSDGGYDLVNTDTYEEYLIRWNEETGQALTGSDEIIEDALMSAEQVFAQWDEYDYGHITSEYWTVQDRSDVPTGPFYVVGGEFAGNVLSANGDLTGSLLNDPGPSPFDWLVAA